ncbi:hypothetical protein JW613_30525 [Streptomyces smyrnaeus]|uniref:Uncharacterized protein n=1 Tax=Streptomyces smyrnaeus TaxID=1387713 RepID=A0ABS3Y4K0_9ACTN|nr:hypothetical protein [Streptomyces smyrnaeus]MBO8202586.1 hypothetical protein [Streptomyces smyrnaeus]
MESQENSQSSTSKSGKMQQSSTSLYMFIFPFCLAVAGFLITFNVRGLTDFVYLRSEKLLSGIFGGIGPRGMRVAGSVALIFGTIGFSVEGAEMMGLI